MNHLWTGVGRCDITPTPGTPQGGWGAATHQRGLGADMPLYATALVISDSQQSVAIIDVDSIGFIEEWAAKIIDAVANVAGLTRDYIRLSCAHTHSGPNTFRLSTITEGLDMVINYLESLPLRIAGAVWQAQRNLKPVNFAAASGKCEINVNRRMKLPDGQMVVGRNWEGPVDPTVQIVRFDDLNGNPVATIVHYACHPTIMAWQCQYFTPDYPGIVRLTVERELGGICLFLQGAAGNISPRRGFTGDLGVYRHLGQLLGLEAAKVGAGIETLRREEHFKGVLQSGAPIALYEDVSVNTGSSMLKVISRRANLPIKQFQPPEELEAEAEKTRQELSRLRNEGNAEAIRAATARATQACWRAGYASRYYGKTHIDWPIQGIRIGSIALISVSGEPFIEINQEITRNSPFAHTLFSGYSHGGFGYIPVRSAYEEGGYEVEASPFSPEAADLLVREVHQLLEELAENSE